MERCKDCQYWEAKQFTCFDGDNHLTVKIEAGEFGICHLPINLDEEGFDDMTPNSIGLDYPVCDLVTGKDFGCVRFEKHSMQ